MVAIEEENVLPGQPRLKPIELKNIGFLQKQPTYIYCPACGAESLSVVRLEVVTCWQKFLKITNCCKKSEGRCDINHYCSNCGCYIGRYVALNCADRYISNKCRKNAANDTMSLKTKPTNIAEVIQKFKELLKEMRDYDKNKHEETTVQDN